MLTLDSVPIPVGVINTPGLIPNRQRGKLMSYVYETIKLGFKGIMALEDFPDFRTSTKVSKN